jgi:sugar O-acyltransferase (sialic acid O-acetyltransferase NeuD family)
MNSHVNKLPSGVILWGGTGQARAVRPIIEYYGSKVVAIFDDTRNLNPPFPDVELHQGVEGFRNWIESQQREDIGFCVAIGNPHGRVRLKLHDFLVDEGLTPVSIVHPTAWVADDAVIGPGAQILAGAIVAAEARLGRQCIINNHALVEHEAHLDDAVEVGPSATVLGLTYIGVNTLVGVSATILSRLKIGSDVTIGAGAVVDADVPDKQTVAGPTKRAL